MKDLPFNILAAFFLLTYVSYSQKQDIHELPEKMVINDQSVSPKVKLNPDAPDVDCVTCPTFDFLISPISSYQILNNSIVSDGCKIYQLTVSVNSTYTFKTGCGDGATAAFDTYLELYNSSCNLITYNDDGCESNRSIITWTADYSGIIYLKIRGYNSSYYGAYTLAFKSDPWCLTCPAYDYSIAPSTNFQVNSSSISSNGCRIYSMNVTSGNEYTFKTGCGDGASAEFDTYIELYNNSCFLIAGDDDGCESNRSIINWTANYSGPAYIKVRGYNYTAFGNYVLAYRGINPEICKACPSYDFTIIPASYFQIHSSSLVSQGCKIYQINAIAGKQYIFKTGCGDGATATFDTYLELYNNGCTVSAYDDDGCESQRSQITWVSTYTGIIYVKVRGYSGAGGSYTLAYNETQPPNIWLGTISYQWENPANWSLGHAPLPSEDVYITPYGYQPCMIIVSDPECNSLEIQAGGNLIIDNKQLKVNGSVGITGNLTMSNASVIRVAFNWWRSLSTGSFTPGEGRVIIDGQYNCSYIQTSEYFNILEINTPYCLIINSATVTCDHYDWTLGGVIVENGGTFTCYDLVDNGLFGLWDIYNTGGTINVYNYNGYVDLNGSIVMTGGTMNVYGGTTYSYWPYVGNAEVYMTDGVLDFRDQGIFINNDAPGYTFIENITGGTIRTSRGFIGNRADFSPAGGTFEFCGTSDYTISQSNGCTLNNVKINKSSKSGEKSYSQGPLIDERSGMIISVGGKSNSITLASDFTITGNLIINAGSTFNLNAYDGTVSGNVDISGILGITYPTDLTANSIYWHSGSGSNITNGTIHVNTWSFGGGSAANIGIGNTAYITNVLIMDYSSSAFGNLVLDGQGNQADNGSKAPEIMVNGNVTVTNGASWSFGYSIVANGNATLQTNSSLAFDTKSLSVGGNANIAGSVLFNNAGIFTVEGDLTFPASGNITLNNAQFTCLHQGVVTLDGSLIMNTGSVASFPERSITIGPNFNDNGITGGTFQFGWSLFAPTPGTFQINSANTGFISTSSATDEINLAANNWLGNVTIQRSMYIEVTNNLTIKGNLDITDNKLQVNGFNLTVEGDINIPHGILSLLPDSQLNIGNSMTVGTYGMFETYGASGNENRVFGGSFGDYGLAVNSGGVIRGEYTTFEDMDDHGIWVKSGAIIDPAIPLNYCTFKNGAAGGSLLTIENNQDIVIQDVIFPDNTWGSSYNVYKSVNAGSVNFMYATGGFSGENYDYDPYSRINWTNRSLSLKAYLEGPFNGTNMNTTLNGILPLSHPFSPALPYFGNSLPDWYYTGAGSVGVIPNANVVDWVLVELRDAISAATATKTTMVAQMPGFILNNGSIVALDGFSNLKFSNSIVNNLYVVIYNRNHQSIMNANPTSYSAGTYSYDYTTGESQVYGGSSGHKQLAPGKWGMRSGDGNGDGDILLNDKTQVWGTSTQIGKTGYLPSDFNLDRQTNNRDKNEKWIPNLDSYSNVPN